MSGEATLRRRIVDMLEYPRQVEMSKVDLSLCPHGGVFNAADETCRKCANNYECDWLNSTEEFNDIAVKPIEFLYRALTFGIYYVNGENTREMHREGKCDCESCKWLESAHDLAHEYVTTKTRIEDMKIREIEYEHDIT